MWDIIAIASWPFWLFLIGFCCLEIYEVESSKNAGMASLVLIIFVSVLLILTDWRPWQNLNIEKVIIYVAAYLAIGVPYMLLRYWIYLNDKFKDFQPEYDRLKAQWTAGRDASKDSWPYSWSGVSTFHEALRASHHMPPYPWDRGVKGMIYLWMAYWPFSAAWTLIHRPIEWFWDWVYLTVKDTLKAMADRTFKAYFPD